MRPLPLSDWTDEQLLAAAAQGDRPAGETLAARYWEAIRRYARGLLADDHLAEDVAQETFAKLAGSSDLPQGAVRPWLYKLARNRCLDILRRRHVSPTHNHPLRTGMDATQSTIGPATRVANEERRRLIAEILVQMPPEYADVLRLKYNEGLPRAEIAEVLGITEAAVKGRLVRASQHLEDELRRLTRPLQ